MPGLRLMVFSTDERLEQQPGQFSPLDCWAMGQYAREPRSVCARINPLAAAARPGLAAVASGLDRPAPEIRALFAP